MLDKKFFFALAILIGTIVGAGIFGIPYVISKSGILVGLFYFLILGGAVLLLHLFFGEIVLRTEGKHRLIGYSQKYLGKWGKFSITIATVLGTIGALLAYIIIGGDFLKIIFFPYFNFSSFYLSLIFWLILSCFVFRGLRSIAPVELLMNILFFLIIILIFGFSFPKINLQNFTLFNLDYLYLPYGVILFALAGWTAIPEIAGILQTKKETKYYKKVIILATLISILLYLFFTWVVIGVSGKNTSPEALQGLLPVLGQKIITLGALFGIFAIASTFLILGSYLKHSFIFDYNLSKFWAVSITCGLPLILFLIGFRSFIGTIGFIGTILGVTEGIIIILIFQRAKILGDRQPEYSLKMPKILIYSLMIIFILGAISQFFYYLK